MKTKHASIIAGAIVAAGLIAASPQAYGASARVSEVVKDVSIGSRQASVGDTVSGSTSVKTGTKSRAELSFQDDTLLRIGSNTIFSFAKSGKAGKDFTLTHGTAFISAPDKHDGVRINCGGVTAAVTGSGALVTNVPGGVCMFAHFGTNGWITPDGFVKVRNGFLTFFPAIKDANGDRIGVDWKNPVTLPFDTVAQRDTAGTMLNLPKPIQEAIRKGYIERFKDGTHLNAPGSADKNPNRTTLQENRRDTIPIEDCPVKMYGYYGKGKGKGKGKGMFRNRGTRGEGEERGASYGGSETARGGERGEGGSETATGGERGEGGGWFAKMFRRNRGERGVEDEGWSSEWSQSAQLCRNQSHECQELLSREVICPPPPCNDRIEICIPDAR